MKHLVFKFFCKLLYNKLQTQPYASTTRTANFQSNDKLRWNVDKANHMNFLRSKRYLFSYFIFQDPIYIIRIQGINLILEHVSGFTLAIIDRRVTSYISTFMKCHRWRIHTYVHILYGIHFPMGIHCEQPF